MLSCGLEVRELLILLLNQYFAPDEAPTAQLLSDVAARAVRAGHRVRVVCCDRGYADPTRRYPRVERGTQLSVLRVPSTVFGRRHAVGRLFDYVGYLLGATAVALSGPRPDVVVGLSTPPILGLLAVVVGRLRRARAVYWVMDSYPELAFELGTLRRRGLVGRLADRLSRLTLRSADLVVALGETMAERLRAMGARRLTIVHNWADGRAIRPLPRWPNAFRGANEWNQRFVVMYSGNLGLVHEFETVLGAAALLEERAEVLFAIVGSGPRRPEVEQEVRRRGLGNVRFYDAVPRERLGESLAAGDLHLVTLREGAVGLVVPSKIYGILAAGRPCLYVGPPTGEVYEMLSRVGCGTCVRNGDAQGLAQAVLSYASDPARCRDEGLRARGLFEQEFDVERQTARLVDALSAVPDR